MLELYGKIYAKNDSELVESLFAPGGTCNGFYKTDRRGIYLYSMRGNLRVFIRRDGLGPVTATKTERSGRIRYMFTTSTADDSWLGTPDSYRETCEQARNLAISIFQSKEPNAMKQRKSIAYAYPSSPIADQFDQPHGCYYVQTSIQLEDGSWSVGSDPVGADTFERASDPDLAALFAEVDGEICPHFKRFATSETARAAGILK